MLIRVVRLPLKKEYPDRMKKNRRFDYYIMFEDRIIEKISVAGV